MTPGALGVDTSSWQGQPDWPAVAAAGRSFVYIKASEGNSSTYATTDAQYIGARAAGLITGLYHYARTAWTPEANADAFASQINRLGAVTGNLPPCLDLEEGAQDDLSGWAQAFITRLRLRTGCRRVMVYSGASFFQSRIGESWMDDQVALWIAHYGRPAGSPEYLTPRVAIHQYASDAQIPGIAGNVDVNYAIWPLSRLVDGDGEDMAQVPQDQWDEMLQKVRDLHEQACTPFAAWGGGVTDDQNTPYVQRQDVMRINVEAHQTRLAVAQLADAVAGLRDDVAALRRTGG